MIRRIQLLEPESRFSRRRLAAVGARIRDGLLRNNRVVPSVLAVLALLIFAWLVAGAFIGGPGEQQQQQSSNQQGSLAQGGDGSQDGASGTPAPEAEERDTDSFARFKSKDPFRDLIPKASETTRANEGGNRTTEGGGDRTNAEDRNGTSRNGSRSGNREDFIDQSFPRDSGSRAGGGAGEDRGSGQGSAAGQGGNGGLFNSGGNLMP